MLFTIAIRFSSPGSTEILPRPIEAVDPRVLPTALFPLGAMAMAV
jgi:hypothetical protein